VLHPGRSRTVALLHGASGNAWWWQPMAEHIPQEFRLVALDQRGHGDSEWVRPPVYGPDEYSADLARLIRQLHHRPLIVGHSMGGINALAYAAHHPETIGGAVAIDVAI